MAVPLLVILTEYIKNVIFEVSDESSSSDSEDDDEVLFTSLFLKNRSTVAPVRIMNYMTNCVYNYTGQQFKEHFRMTRTAVENVLVVIGPHLSNQNLGAGRPAIEPEKQLLSILWLLATPDSFRSVGDRFGLSKATLYQNFIRVVNALNIISPGVIQWPSGDYINEVVHHFSRTRLNGVIGIIDGTYIKIKAPKDHPEVYICRKKFHAITLQAVCDHHLKFTNCFVGYPGSVNDVRIFRNSDLYKEIIVNNNMGNYFPNDEMILADKAYPLRRWCICPYINRGNLTVMQRNFNTQLSKIRQTIERTFSLLKGRFRRLKDLDMNRVDLIPSTILACCVLHNFCITDGDIDENYIIEGRDHEENEDINIPWNEGGEDEGGRMRRDRMARALFH